MKTALLAATALLLVACGGPTTSTPTPLLGGIDVFTVEGPTCPVQQQGQSCTRPFAATVVVTRPDGSVAARVQSSSNGRAHIPLPPGSYTVRGDASARLPRAEAAKTVTVPEAQFVTVQLSFDTGIR